MSPASAWVLALAALGALAACDPLPDAAVEDQPAQTSAIASPGPDLAMCDAAHEMAEGAGGNSKPVEIDPQFREIAASSPQELAVLTRSGATVCVNLSWIGEISDLEWLSDDRLLGFATLGYEAFGYVVIDRKGTGSQAETGDRPQLSPGGNRFASVQVSESGWGGLEGFAVWEMADDGLRQLGGELPGADFVWAPVFLNEAASILGEWKITGWSGETCVGLGLAPYDATTEDYDWSAAKSFHAAEADGWHIRPGTCP